MTDDRWADTTKLCNGFASYNGPCGDPYCSDCYPGGQVCTECKEIRGCCECDNCEECGKEWVEKYGKDYDECPFCSCYECGEIEEKCECKEGFIQSEK